MVWRRSLRSVAILLKQKQALLERLQLAQHFGKVSAFFVDALNLSSVFLWLLFNFHSDMVLIVWSLPLSFIFFGSRKEYHELSLATAVHFLVDRAGLCGQLVLFFMVKVGESAGLGRRERKNFYTARFKHYRPGGWSFSAPMPWLHLWWKSTCNLFILY